MLWHVAQGGRLADCDLARKHQIQITWDTAVTVALARTYSEDSGVRAMEYSSVLEQAQEALMTELNTHSTTVHRIQCKFKLQGDSVECDLVPASKAASPAEPDTINFTDVYSRWLEPKIMENSTHLAFSIIVLAVLLHLFWKA